MDEGQGNSEGVRKCCSEGSGGGEARVSKKSDDARKVAV